MNRWQLLILALILGMTQSFAEEAEDKADDEETVERVCINKHQINSFDAIDDQHVYIGASGKRHFLFTMRNRCFGLRNANAIGIKETMSRVCSDGFGEIVYRDMSRRMMSCHIGNIETVASKDDAKGLVDDRKQRKEEERAKQ